MTALVYGFVRAASAGWSNRVTVASFVAGAALLATFVLTEMRAEQPITPLHLFASRERARAPTSARVLVVSGMFAMFFFLTQFLQGVLGYSALQAGLAFLPVTAVMFGAARMAPRIAPRVGNTRLLAGGVFRGHGGHGLAEPDHGRHGATSRQIALPMLLLGLGIGTALDPADHGRGGRRGPEGRRGRLGCGQRGPAAGGLAGSGHPGHRVRLRQPRPRPPCARIGARTGPRQELAHGVSTALRGSAIFLVLGLVTVVTVMWRPIKTEADATELGLEQALSFED